MSKIKNSFSVKLFLLILLISLPISLLLFVGKIDPDFFSYYYIGRGVNLGMDMFRDFAENKGPFNAYFFAILYKIFNNNYRLALFSANWIVDSFSVYFLVQLIRKWICPFKINLKQILVLFLIIGFYKSFSITSLMAGVYPETIAMSLVLASIYLLTISRHCLSGILFAGAVLTRQTEFFFIPIYFFLFSRNKSIKDLVKWIVSGILFTLLVLSLYLFNNGDLFHLFDNMIILNFNRIGIPAQSVLRNFLAFSIIDFRMTFSLLFALAIGFFVFIKSNNENRRFILVLIISFFSATFLQATFYPHHFLQFVPIIILIFFWGYKYKFRFLKLFLALMIFFSFANYYFYYHSNLGSLENEVIKEKLISLEYKKYLQVTPYYPELYFYLNKFSPDRYYQGFFLSNLFTKNAWKYQAEHRALSVEKLRNTTFLFIKKSEGDKTIIDEYKSNFQIPFRLEKVDTVNVDGYQIETYESKI